MELVRVHPARAAAALDRLSAAAAAAPLTRVPPAAAAAAVASLSPQQATDVLARFEPAAAAAIVDALEQDVASRLVRRLAVAARAAVLAHLPARTARVLETLLRFPEHSAGALMDPEVLALAEDLTVAEAMERIRAVPDQARYNLYVVDRRQRLTGVINLREILLAPPEARLGRIMIRDPERLAAHADRAAVVSHPGWRRVHSIPVVDEHGSYLGAVRYRTLRQLEEELLGAAQTDADTAAALGELFASGAAGLMDAVTGPPGRRGTG